MSKLYGDFAAIYDRLMDDFAYPNWLDGLKELLSVLEINPSKALEIGCGTGNFTALLQELCPVTAVDQSPAMLDLARQKPIEATWICADALTMNLADTFPLVVCSSDMMHYIAPEKRRPLMENLSRHLTSGGLLIFDWRDAADLEAVDGAISIHDEEDLYAVYGYTLEEDRLFIDVQGFVEEDGSWKRIKETHTLYLGDPHLWETLGNQTGLTLVAKRDLAVREGEPEEGDRRDLLAFRKEKTHGPTD